MRRAAAAAPGVRRARPRAPSVFGGPSSSAVTSIVIAPTLTLARPRPSGGSITTPSAFSRWTKTRAPGHQTRRVGGRLRRRGQTRQRLGRDRAPARARPASAARALPACCASRTICAQRRARLRDGGIDRVARLEPELALAPGERRRRLALRFSRRDGGGLGLRRSRSDCFTSVGSRACSRAITDSSPTLDAPASSRARSSSASGRPMRAAMSNAYERPGAPVASRNVGRSASRSYAIAGVREARVAFAQRLQAVVVRGDDRQPGALGQRLRRRARQRRALIRVGARHQLVEEHQRRARRPAPRRQDVGDGGQVAGERRQVAHHRLAIADVGAHVGEEPDPAARRRRRPAAPPAPSAPPARRSSSAPSCRPRSAR